MGSILKIDVVVFVSKEKGLYPYALIWIMESLESKMKVPFSCIQFGKSNCKIKFYRLTFQAVE